MEPTNNPDEGTGYSVADAATRIESLLDSEGTTEEVDADSEIEEVSQTSDEDVDGEETEQSDEDSEETENANADETDEEVSEPNSLSDDTLVDVNGQKITLKEIRNGYLRQSDYTKKTQELKQHMNAYALQQRDLGSIRAEVIEKQNEAIRLFNATFNMYEPNWEQLAYEDPAMFNVAKLDWDKKLQAVHGMEMLRREAIAKQEKAQAEQIAIAQMQALDTLSEKYPNEFGDATKQNGLLREVGGYLANLGFDESEITNIADAKLIETAYKAMKYDRMTQQKSHVVKKMQNKPALTQPNSPATRTSTRDNSLQKNRDRLKQSGGIDDAAALISKYFE